MDNIILNPGAGGATVKTDDVSGVHIPASKIVLGADGVDSGYVAVGNPLPVSDAGGSITVDGTVAVSGTVPVSDGGSTLSVDDGGGSLTVDGSVSVGTALPAGTNNIGDVDVITLPALPAGNNNIGDVDVASLPAGTFAGQTPKTADYDSGGGTDTVAMLGLALPASGGAVAGGTSTNPVRTDPTGTTAQPITDNGGSLTVDGSVAITGAVAVTDNSGSLTVDDGNTTLSVDDGGGSLTVDGSVSIGSALPAGTNNIGDVDVLTLPSGSIAAATAKTADYDSGAGTDTVAMMGLALPASGGAVAGGTSTNPVRTDPTGTTAQPVTDNGGTLSVDDGAGSLTVDGTVGVSGTVTVDSELPAAAALADATSNPTVPTVGAANLLYNGSTWDRVRGDTSNGLDVDVTRLPALVAGSAIIGAARMVVGEVVDAAGNALTVKTAFVRVNTSGDNNTIVAAVTSKKIRVLSYWIQSEGTVSVKFQSGVSGTPTQISALQSYQAREGTSRSAPAGTFLFETASGIALGVNLSGAVAVNVELVYLEVA